MEYAVPRSRTRFVVPVVLVAAMLAVLVVLASVVRGGTGPAKPAGPAATRIAINGSADDVARNVEAAARLGARQARVEFGIGSSVEELRPVIAAYAERGVQVMPLAGFRGRMPSPEEARNLAAWAREFGPDGPFWSDRDDAELAIETIEFGNESSYGDQGVDTRAGEYAERVRDAHEALQGSEGNAAVGLLVQADDANSGGDEWVRWMFDAVPDLGRRVAGWTIHPYGPEWRDRIDRLIEQTTDQGAPADLPIHVTEWGLTSDDGRCLSGNYGWDECMTYEEAADTLREVLDGMREQLGPQLRSFVVYQAMDQRERGATDDREHYFGALDAELEPKGRYGEEVRAQLARSVPPGSGG